MNQEVSFYVHRPLEETVVAIGGHYRFTDEVCIRFDEKDLLYLKGYAVFDTSCCGAGGCIYAVVQGFVEQWKAETDSEGFSVSRIRRVTDPNLRQEISKMIKSREMVQQVQFA